MEKQGKMRRKFWTVMSVVFTAAIVAVVGVALGLLSVPAVPFVGTFLISALCLLLYTWLSSVFYFRVLEQTPQAVARYYMIHMLARFVFSGIVLFVCNYLVGVGVKPALIGFAVLFLLTLFGESCMFVHIERNLNENKSSV